VNDSRIIISNQTGLHDKLETVVRRHLNKPFLRPFPDYSLEVFEQAKQRVDKHQGPIIFDSFCGVGESTAYLAKVHPNALVIGIDKSSYRINKHNDHYRLDTEADSLNESHDSPDSNSHNNYLLLRADVDDFWRLAEQDNWQLAAHYLLYPNPWPKSSQLQRRVHGSAVFPSLLALGGEIELRSNWPIYVQEFAAALTLAGHSATAQTYQPTRYITPFERKYSESGQTLWRSVHTPTN
jgi:tRNA (guanine-N7-)-methyltransferase